MHMDLYAVTILLLRGYHHLTTVSSVNSELFFSTRAHCAWQNMGAFYNGVWHCPTQDPCLYIGKTWIWLNDYSLDKDLPRLSHSKSSGQWLNVQVETSGIPQGLVLGLTLLTSLLLIWTVGLSACSASLLMTWSWIVQLIILIKSSGVKRDACGTPLIATGFHLAIELLTWLWPSIQFLIHWIVHPSNPYLSDFKIRMWYGTILKDLQKSR